MFKSQTFFSFLLSNSQQINSFVVQTQGFLSFLIFKYSCAPLVSWGSVVAQLVKNLPAIWETWDRSLGWEDPLEKGMATHSSILAWRIPWTVHGVAKSRTRLSDFHFTSLCKLVKPFDHSQTADFK